jgi:hypothetical protein
VPEAAIDEECKAAVAKNKVWLAEHWLMTPPAFNALRAHELHKEQFRPFVSVGTDTRHHFGAPRFGKNVGH